MVLAPALLHHWWGTSRGKQICGAGAAALFFFFYFMTVQGSKGLLENVGKPLYLPILKTLFFLCLVLQYGFYTVLRIAYYFYVTYFPRWMCQMLFPPKGIIRHMPVIYTGIYDTIWNVVIIGRPYSERWLVYNIVMWWVGFSFKILGKKQFLYRSVWEGK